MTERDWSWVDQERVTEAVHHFANMWSWKFGSVEDARHEAYAYIAEHPQVIGEMTVGSGLLYLRLGQRVGRSRKSEDDERQLADEGTEVETYEAPTAVAGTYTTERVARLAAVCFGEEHPEVLSDPFGEQLSPEIKRFTSRDPSHANDLWAVVADIKWAFTYNETNNAKLTHQEQRSFYGKFVADFTRSEMRSQGMSERAALAALVKVTNTMNGAKIND